VNACVPRSPEALCSVVVLLDVERNPVYKRRDVTGDRVPETWCNTFVADATACLGVPVPRLLANDMVRWLDGPAGIANGWGRLTLHRAEVLACHGYPVIIGWENKKGHGHVALGVPTPAGHTGLHVAQAGVNNFSSRPVLKGFGLVDFHCWGHD
jgi:hypothetical protein